MSKDDVFTSRRNLLKSAAVSAASLALEAFTPPGAVAAETRRSGPHASMMGVAFEPKEAVRLGVIGLGGRGLGMLSNFLAVEGVRINAVCDIVEEKVRAAQSLVQKAGGAIPEGYSHGDRDFEHLCQRDDLDFVYVATPWEWHASMAVSILENGKHAGVEVPAFITIEDCWKLVEMSERSRRHCILMENCCYGYNEMLVRNAIKAGVFGELLHAEAGYLHDLREILFSDTGEGLWRRAWHTRRNGNLYPTHGLGPVALYMDIQRGDRFEHIVSMSSPERGLSAWRKAHVSASDPKWKEKYLCGDINISLIKTALGRTIVLQHDTCNPRPYDRLNMVAGTNGIFRDYPPRVYLEGQTPEAWGEIDTLKKYEHPLWTNSGEQARGLAGHEGHGGMDFIMVYRLVQCMRQGLVPDLDVYDAAAWSAPGPLSVASVARGSAPVAFPDFTRDRWRVARS